MLYRIQADDADITRATEQRLTALSVTLSADSQSDTLDLTLDAAHLAVPKPGKELRVALGHPKPVPLGVYFLTEATVSHPPRLIRLRAAAADFRRHSRMKAPRTRAWDDTTLGQIVENIAADHGWQGLVAPDLSGFAIPHLDQTDESDLHLLRRLAKHHDATVKAAGARLLLLPRGSGRTAGTGKFLPHITVRPENAAQARARHRDRSRYRSVRAAWFDFTHARMVHEQAGTGEPVFQIREPLRDRSAARAAAQARLKRLTRHNAELNLTVPGNPDIVAESPILMAGWGPGLDGQWSVVRAVHTLDKNRGYTTKVTAETAEN